MEIIAGIQALVKRNAFAATAFCANGALWLILGFMFTCWTVANVITLILARQTSIALIAVFFAVSIAFVFLAIGAFSGSSGMTEIGGWLGIISAVLAWYTAVALLLAEAKNPLRLPLGVRG